jgi:hypothetical protein
MTEDHASFQPEPLDNLIARLEAGGDTDDCDERLARWLYENPGLCGALVNYAPPLWLERNGGWSTSLDAALALAERQGLDARKVIMEAVNREPWNRYADLARYACIAILKATRAGYVAEGEVSPNPAGGK